MVPAPSPSVALVPSPVPDVASQPLKVALVQMAPMLGDRQRNFATHLTQIAAAREQQADLIVFPELSLTGYFLRDIVPDVALLDSSPELGQLIEAAGPAAVAFGFVEESVGHHFYNSAMFGEQGRAVHIHRKVYLPTYGLFEEQRYFAAGKRIAAFESARFGRVGMLVCEDLWHLSAAAIMQAEGVDVLICLANSPARGVDRERPRTAEVYDRLAGVYAQMLGAVVIIVNRVGFEDGLCFWGGSQMVGPDGSIIAQAPLFDEALNDRAVRPGRAAPRTADHAAGPRRAIVAHVGRT